MNQPWRQWGLIGLLFTAWCLPGLFGRDPWKADEGYSFGLVLNIIETGDKIVPTLAGEPFMEKPPVLYLNAAAAAKLLAPILPLHVGARMALLLFHGLTFFALAMATRKLNGSGPGWLAPVVLIGCLGFLHDSHMLMTDVALFSGMALGHCGLALALSRPWVGGLLAGTGAGIAFLAKGLLGPGFLGLTALLLPIVGRPWRTRQYLLTLAGCVLAALPWVVIWPGLLYARSSVLFHQWIWDNNIGRFTGAAGLGPQGHSWLYFRDLTWYAFPALPLALWSWWRGRKEFAQRPLLPLTLLSFAIMLGVLTAAHDGRTLYAQPMLVPLVLAAVPALAYFTEKSARRVLVGMAIFQAVVLSVLWLAWGAELGNWPAAVWTKVHGGIFDYAPKFYAHLFVVALAGTALWAWRTWRTEEKNGPALVVNWAAGVACAYLLAMTLFLPMTDARNTFRNLFQDMRKQLPSPNTPLASKGLGESERAMMHYFAGIKTHRLEVDTNALATCDYLLVQKNSRDGELAQPPATGQWEMLWDRQRIGRESFRLFKKVPGSQPQGGTNK